MENRPQAIILSTGLETRFRPLSLSHPKILAPICNSSILNRLLNQLQYAGFEGADLAMRVLPNSIRELLLNASPPGFTINLKIIPEEIDGTVNVVRHVMEKQLNSIMVIYGDSFLSLDFTSLLHFHDKVREHKGVGTIVYTKPDDLLKTSENGRTYHGIMSIDNSGRITEFIEKPLLSSIRPGFDLANAAVFILERKIFEDETLKKIKDFSRELFPQIVNNDLYCIYGYGIGSGYRFDIGTLERLYEANIKVIRGEIKAVIPGKEEHPGIWIGKNVRYHFNCIKPPVVIGDDVYIGKNANVGPDVIIAKGCQIGNEAVIHEAVIMEDCILSPGINISKCILGPNSQVGENINLSGFTVLGAYSIINGNKEKHSIKKGDNYVWE